MNNTIETNQSYKKFKEILTARHIISLWLSMVQCYYVMSSACRMSASQPACWPWLLIGATPQQKLHWITLWWKCFLLEEWQKVVSVVDNYLLALLLIHCLRTSICVHKYLYMLSAIFHDQSANDDDPDLSVALTTHQVHGHFLPIVQETLTSDEYIFWCS